MAGLPRGRNRSTRTEDTHDGGPGSAARHSARLTPLTTAGQSLAFRYLCGLTVLLTHVGAIACIAIATRFTDFRDQVGSILIVAPITLVYEALLQGMWLPMLLQLTAQPKRLIVWPLQQCI